jgi:uncharacterized protein YybS (DUF2232 family)
MYIHFNSSDRNILIIPIHVIEREEKPVIALESSLALILSIMTHAYKSSNKLQYIKAYQSRSSYKSSAAINITATMSTTQLCPDDVLHVYHCDLCNEQTLKQKMN